MVAKMRERLTHFRVRDSLDKVSIIIYCKTFILAGLKFGGFEFRAIWQDFILALRRSLKNHVITKYSFLYYFMV